MDKTKPLPTDLLLATSRQARLKLARKMRGLSSTEVAQKLGVSKPAMTRWENEDVDVSRAGITVENLFAICKIYQINPEWVVDGTLPMEAVTKDVQSAAARNNTQALEDPLQKALETALQDMAKQRAENDSLKQDMQRLVLNDFLENGLDDFEREILTLYVQAKAMSHLPRYEFLIVTLRAALYSFHDLKIGMPTKNVSSFA